MINSIKGGKKVKEGEDCIEDFQLVHEEIISDDHGNSFCPEQGENIRQKGVKTRTGLELKQQK